MTKCWAASTFFSQGGEVISVLAAWVIDGGTFHIQDCKADSFLMAAHQGARLHATEFVVVNSLAAGMLVSSGEVTMRASVKQRCVVFCFHMFWHEGCRFCMFVRVGQCVPATEVLAYSIRQVPRNSGPTAGCLLLQLCETSKKRNSANIIRFIMFLQQVETQRSRSTSEIL